jgi:hypothetical protein
LIQASYSTDSFLVTIYISVLFQQMADTCFILLVQYYQTYVLLLSIIHSLYLSCLAESFDWCSIARRRTDGIRNSGMSSNPALSRCRASHGVSRITLAIATPWRLLFACASLLGALLDPTLPVTYLLIT